MFTLPQLPYAFDALEPYIDAKTMEIHYTKHHQAYIDNLNKALANYPVLQQKSLDYLLTHLDEIPDDIRMTVRNNAGGHYNHSFFWPSMKKSSSKKSEGPLLNEITKTFGDVAQFHAAFDVAAKSVFGSGWAWLVRNKQGNLAIETTPNQDSPITKGHLPIIGLDVWEHAYYLKYQNKRPDYVQAWWNVINWDFSEELFKK